ncbi:hypothetical protein GDO81_022089 [Engystomops pustulosus]|uniref:Uncharacterized protein n=2 Tax=Engystomops pustulosus TaxID=76066 RepID=A0AAV6YV36_ENGPU|nr:hypothetical protein GDO81_022089 [Engystomops pustulosus]
MPRAAASKSRGDKSRSVTVAPLPQVSVDIIPGRFTEDDWMTMVGAEDGEDVVGDIVDSLIDRVMEECLMVHLQSQLIPYTVGQARDAMLQIVQWTFVPRDEGDVDLDTGKDWREEPLPCPHDSWAQGCVPVTQHVLTPRSSQSQGPPQHLAIPEEESLQDITPPEPEKSPPASSEEQTTPPEAETKRASEPTRKPTPPAAPPKNRPGYRPHRGPLPSAGLKNITKSLEETEKEMFLEQLVREEGVTSENLLPTSLHNILKIQLGRPPQKKDVMYDDAGNVLSMPKVAISRLPQHHVRPRIQVLDVSRESTDNDTRRRNRQNLRKGKEARKASPVIGTRVCSFSNDPPHLHSTRAEDLPGRASMPAAIHLDTMPLTHGVILRLGDSTERGSVYSLQQRERAQTERGELRPIQAAIPHPNLRVEQLLRNNIPQVQPLVSFMSH